ncbi:MAG: hypothetical protein V3S24_09270 [Candidatus Tectomicrobia bacterium]
MEEDRWALEKQQAMFAYPDDGYEEVLIGSDETMQRARKILAALEATE